MSQKETHNDPYHPILPSDHHLHPLAHAGPMKYVIPTMVGALYIVQAVIHISKKEWGMAIMWFAYGLANVGICITMLETGKDH